MTKQAIPAIESEMVKAALRRAPCSRPIEVDADPEPEMAEDCVPFACLPSRSPTEG